MRNAAARPDGEINLTSHLTAIIADIVRRTPSLGHIDVGRVLICIGSNRSGRRGGMYGKLIPLRFENGTEIVRYRGRYYTLPAVSHNGADCLYIIYFYMPRFFDLPWKEKLRVIFHELYHISPRFDGDIRRMGAVKSAHGHSKKHFDSLYAAELAAFSEHVCSSPALAFLEMNTSALYGSYRKVTGVRMKSPKPVLLEH
jgi:hypothetical protein